VPDEKEFDASTDTDPVEFLRRLPGITPFNISKVIDQVDNIHELSKMSKTKLTELLGMKGGQQLHTFLNKSYN
jgi:ERCC4-type nuclease